MNKTQDWVFFWKLQNKSQFDLKTAHWEYSIPYLQKTITKTMELPERY